MDLSTGKQIGTTLDIGDDVSSVAFSPDGKTLAADGSSLSGGAQLWDVSTGKLTGTPGSDSVVTSVAFSPDGKTLATGTFDRGTRLWDLSTGKQIGTTLNTGSEVIVTSVAFSPDGRGGGWRHPALQIRGQHLVARHRRRGVGLTGPRAGLGRGSGAHDVIVPRHTARAPTRGALAGLSRRRGAPRSRCCG